MKNKISVKELKNESFITFSRKCGPKLPVNPEIELVVTDVNPIY
jgi:hypothetical protein